MVVDPFYKLDNPAWHSLGETHRHFALEQPGLKRYQPAIVSFLAFQHENPQALNRLDDLTEPNEFFFIIGDLPPLPANYVIETRLACEQMICTELTDPPAMSATIEKLNDTDEEQMLSLINLVQPGYFLPRTRLMGDYYGIRHNDEVVAMTGERMRMQGLTEISAVVTHPSFTGRGYAQQLLAYAVNKNLVAGIIPFLHVAAINDRAIAIYKKLGFATRRIIDFWKIRRQQ